MASLATVTVWETGRPLSELDGEIASANADLGAITDWLTQHRGDRATILGKSRKAEIVQNRQMAMYLCKALTPLTFRAIATEFGGRDHATVVHSCRKFTERCRRDPSLLWEAKLIAKKLGFPNAELDPGSSNTD